MTSSSYRAWAALAARAGDQQSIEFLLEHGGREARRRLARAAKRKPAKGIQKTKGGAR